MGPTPRQTRWPGARQLRMKRERLGTEIVDVRNASLTGLRFDGGPDLRTQDRMMFRVMGRTVSGRVARLADHGGALVFDAPFSGVELATPRQ